MTEITWDNIRPTTDVRLDRSPYQQGRDDERAAVLAYLRANLSDACDEVFDAIEAGEHLKPSADQ